MNSPMIYIKKLMRKGSRADPRHTPRDRIRHRTHAVLQTQIKQTQMSYDCSRESVIMVKKDSEAFGFEIRTYDQKNNNCCDEDVLTCVCTVRESSPAAKAGLRTGDVICSVNSVCVDGFDHQQIVDLIQTSCLLKMEILRGTTVKQKELQKKLNHLEWQLNEKWAELKMLIVQEERLQRGDLSSTHSDFCPDLEHPTLNIPSC